MASQDQIPTSEQAIALFESIEQKYPHKTLGEETWYLVVVCQHVFHSIAEPYS